MDASSGAAGAGGGGGAATATADGDGAVAADATPPRLQRARAVHGSQLHWEDLDKTKFMLFMPLGALAIRVVAYPFSLVKTRMQADLPPGARPYRGVTDAFRTIARTEGPRALYKGFGVSLLHLAIGPVYLPVLETTRSAITERLHDRPQLAAVAAPFAAGMAASCVAQLLVVPIDVISQVQMTARDSAAAPGTVAVTRRLVETQGLRSLWRGYFVSLFTYAPASAIMWTTFTAVNTAVTGHLPQRWFAPQVEHASPFDGVGASMGVAAFSGAVAGGVAGTITNPVDVIRARLQLEEGARPSARETLRVMLRQYGYRGFWRGLNARVLAMAQGTASMQCAYELLKRMSATRQDAAAPPGWP
uniref:Mitochondrial carrier protein n=1 Tax=Bicosoecida sp. CB-2014 TaxID=1486930 RepID=A0A7S1G425_9STRA|mmetsp:Transcript_10087/g.35342  ORF Transcript_10087/g.35342 Transcript_10087/m.35342 type:complete len:361 (+) Transcript_10087:280-1362(+)